VTTFRTEGRRNAPTGQTYPWLVRTTALVNQYYGYGIDEDFGPFFLKFSSSFPSNAKLCINGHEYVKRQLAQEGIAFAALDNGLRSCDDPQRLQEIAAGLTAQRIDALLRQGLARLPHPFTAVDRQAGSRSQVSILQAECSLTQVLDRPVAGRICLAEVSRENRDLQQRDGEVTSPQPVGTPRASALPWGNELVLPRLPLLLRFRRLPCGFGNRELRVPRARLRGQDPETGTAGQRT
jgi:hypothetical protein